MGVIGRTPALESRSSHLSDLSGGPDGAAVFSELAVGAFPPQKSQSWDRLSVVGPLPAGTYPCYLTLR